MSQQHDDTDGRDDASTDRRLCRRAAPTPAERAPRSLNTKPLFKLMVEKKASDLFFTSNAPIKIKIEGQIFPVNKQVLTPETVRQAAFGADDAGADRVLPARAGDRLRDLRARPRPLPRQRLQPARLSRDGACATSPPTCRGSTTLGLPDVMQRPDHAQARPGADGRRHRLGQVHHARGDDQLPQRELLGSHRHHRGSDRVPAHEQALDRQPARSRARHQVLRTRPARRDARRART